MTSKAAPPLSRPPSVSKRRVVEAGRVLARLSRFIEKTCADGDLSLPQYRLLLLVSRLPQRAGELASRATVSRPAITDLVDSLARNGFLQRVPVNGDRRGIALQLTDAGAEAIRGVEDSLAGKLKPLLVDDDLVQGLIDLGATLDKGLESHLKSQERR